MSDHAAVSISFAPPFNHYRSKQCRLNTSLLKNTDFVSRIKVFFFFLDKFELSINCVHCMGSPLRPHAEGGLSATQQLRNVRKQRKNYI